MRQAQRLSGICIDALVSFSNESTLFKVHARERRQAGFGHQCLYTSPRTPPGRRDGTAWPRFVDDIARVISSRLQSVSFGPLSGTSLGLLQRFEEADVDFSRVIEANSACADAWKRRGQVRASQRRSEDAMKDLSHAMSLTPLDGEIFYERGCCRRCLKDFASAKVHVCELQRAAGIADRFVYLSGRSISRRLSSEGTTPLHAIGRSLSATPSWGSRRRRSSRIALRYRWSRATPRVG